MIIEYNASTHSIEMRISGDTSDVYPKSYKVYNSKTWDNNSQSYCFVGIRINAILRADEINKGANESGLKRIEKFVKHVIKLHGPIQFKRMNDYLNNIELPEVIARLEA